MSTPESMDDTANDLGTADEPMVKFTIKFSNSEYPIEFLNASNTVIDLKSYLECETNILPTRQKLLGLRRTDGKFSLYFALFFDIFVIFLF